MKKSGGYYEYDCVIYPRKLWVHIGYDLKEVIRASFDGADPPEKEGYYGITYDEVTRKSDRSLGVLVSFHSRKDMTMDVIAHESSHAVDAIESATGITHGDEPSAYLMGWVASCIDKARIGDGDYICIDNKGQDA